MKQQTAVEWLTDELQKAEYIPKDSIIIDYVIKKSKEIEEKNLLEMLHKFGFDYTYNYRGEKTIYEWIPEWFEEYKKLNKLW